jgi:hypothetical protein
VGRDEIKRNLGIHLYFCAGFSTPSVTVTVVSPPVMP